MKLRLTLAGLPLIFASYVHAAELTANTRKACATGKCFAMARVDSAGDTFSNAEAPAGGYGPADIQAAYNIDTSKQTPATVALIEAYDNPNAEADLAVYRAYFGLPPCTTANGCFRKVNQNGDTSPLPAPAPLSNDWTLESSLDLDAVSSACPSCRILLVESDDDFDIQGSYGINLVLAQNTAANLGATSISNSWGAPVEFFGQQVIEDTYFNHPGVAIFASAGDNGFGVQFPAVLNSVISVGGTSLIQDTQSPRGWTETAWTGTGAGCSGREVKAAFQANLDNGCSYRAMNDLSAVADPNTGLAVYDTSNGNGGWTVVGGTSLSSPLVAAIFAGSTNGGRDQSFIYANAGAFYDVANGVVPAQDGTLCAPIFPLSATSKQCVASAGWDGPTGVGTPNAAALLALATAGTSSGNPPPVPNPSGGGCTFGNFWSGLGQVAVALPLRRWFRKARKQTAPRKPDLA